MAITIPASLAESGHPLSLLRLSTCVVVAVEFVASTVCGARFVLVVAVAMGIDVGPAVVLMRVIVLLVVLVLVLVLVMSAVINLAAVVTVDAVMVVVVVGA